MTFSVWVATLPFPVVDRRRNRCYDIVYFQGQGQGQSLAYAIITTDRTSVFGKPCVGLAPYVRLCVVAG